MQIDLTGRAALVTGASRGIGRAIALRLAECNASVLLVATNEALLKSLSEEISSKGKKCAVCKANVANAKEAEQAVNAAIGAFGKLEILVNNAGITRDNLLMRMSEQEWDEVLSVNLKGAFNLTKASLRQMMKQRFGRIINITSVSGLTGLAGQANYSASKAGLIAFTKVVAKEYGSRNITANCVAPGFVETDMTAKLPEEQRKKAIENIPLQRFAAADDIANAVAFLASECASYVTGQTLVVDGGMTMV